MVLCLSTRQITKPQPKNQVPIPLCGVRDNLFHAANGFETARKSAEKRNGDCMLRMNVLHLPRT